MIKNYKDIDAATRFKLVSNTVVPRPIAWIVTVDEGIVNAAPFSYFTPLSSDPATLLVAIGEKEDGSQKDTLSNILKNKKATICFVNKDNKEEMYNCALPLDKNESETEKFNIKVEYMLEGYPPLIHSTQSALFCDFHSQVALEGTTIPVILEIKQQFIQDELIDEKNNIDIHNIAGFGTSYKELIDI